MRTKVFRFFAAIFCIAALIAVNRHAIANETAKPETVTIAVFEKHQFYLTASNSYGLSWKLLTLAAAMDDIKLIPVEARWQATLNRLKQNKVPLAYPAFRTKERESWASFSFPMTKENVAIFTRHSNTAERIDDIDLNTVSVGVTALSHQEKLAKQLGFKNIYPSKDRIQLYHMLANGRIDYLVYAQGMINYFCLYYSDTKQPNCLKQFGEPIDFNQTYAIAYQGNDYAISLLQRINDQMLALASGSSSQAIFEEYGYSQQEFDDWAEAVKRAATN